MRRLLIPLPGGATLSQVRRCWVERVGFRRGVRIGITESDQRSILPGSTAAGRERHRRGGAARLTLR